MAGSGKQQLTSLAEHPRAGGAIRRAKGLGGLVGFGLAVLVGLQHGEPFAPMVLRGLELGFAGYLAAWTAAVVIWKRLLTAQAVATVRDVQEQRRRRLAASTEAAE